MDFEFKFPEPTHGKNPDDYVSMEDYKVNEIEFDRVVNLNLKGTYFLTQKVAIKMKERGGKMVLISSSVSKIAYPYKPRVWNKLHRSIGIGIDISMIG